MIQYKNTIALSFLIVLTTPLLLSSPEDQNKSEQRDMLQIIKNELGDGKAYIIIGGITFLLTKHKTIALGVAAYGIYKNPTALAYIKKISHTPEFIDVQEKTKQMLTSIWALISGPILHKNKVEQESTPEETNNK